MMRATATTICVLMLLIWAGQALASVPADVEPGDFGESKYAVLVDGFADRQQVKPGEQFSLAVRYSPFHNDNVKFHIYTSEPHPQMLYINTQLSLVDETGAEWETWFAPAEEHETSLGILAWYSEPTTALLRVTLPADTAAGPLTLTARSVISACTEEMCLPPSEVFTTFDVEVVPTDFAGQIDVLAEDELTAPVELDLERFVLKGSEAPEEDGTEAESTVETTATAGVFTPAVLDFLEKISVEKPSDLALWLILLMALAGGLILNVMPCVLPVVSIKIIDLVRSMEKEKRSIWVHGLLFVAGIISTFLLGAIIIAIIQVAGTQLNWGFQFQSPWFVIAMAAVMFLFGLSLADVFKIKPPAAVSEGGGKVAEQEGAAGSFFKGVLATLLGTPCVGPFLGPALGVAFTREWYDTILIFAAVGIGMALPYFFILPFVARMGRRERGQLSRKMQESKAWMDHFKHFMAFLLFGTVIWMLYILAGQVGTDILRVLWFLLGVALAAWMWGELVKLGKKGVLIGLPSALLIIILAGVFSLGGLGKSQGNAPVVLSAEGWSSFNLVALEQLTVQEHETVLVDFTADWCPNCKTNELVALDIESTMNLAEELGIVMMVADWTNPNEEIQRILTEVERQSVPLTAIFPASDPYHPILLDGVFTPEQVQAKMREAAGS